MKKSFILFKDSLDVLDELTDEQAGKLFKAIKQFQNGKETDLDFSLKIAFVPFKNQFIRDDKDYFEFIEKQREKGLKSAQARLNKNQPKSTTVNSGQPASTYTDTVNDTVNVNEKKEIDLIYNLYPSKCPIKNSSTGKTQTDKIKIKTLLKDKSFDDLRIAIENYVNECVKSKTWLKNFKTFLNNIPDYSASTIIEIKPTHNITRDVWFIAKQVPAEMNRICKEYKLTDQEFLNLYK